MHHITIRLEDDRFDGMLADEIPSLILDMIKHHLWNLTDPWVHLSEVEVAVPPGPELPGVGAAALAVEAESECDLEELQQIIRLETALAEAKAA